MKKAHVPQWIYEQLLGKAKEDCSGSVDLLSDVDMCYNPSTDKFDLFGVEWDGLWGKHWDVYHTAEERDEAIKRKQAESKRELDEMVQDYVGRLQDQWLARQAEKERTRPTLGNLYAEAFAKLKPQH